MSEGTFERKKASTSNFSHSSLVSPHTPTLANPVRGFGLATNNVIQAQTLKSTNQQQTQPAEESLLSQAIGQRSFSHDISRIGLRRPQAKLSTSSLANTEESKANWVNDLGGEIIPEVLQRQTAADNEQQTVQRTADTPVIQRDETTSLPPVPNYQLSPPSLLQPRDPASRYGLGMDMHLQLDPQLLAMARQYTQQQLNPATIRPALNQINLGVLPTQGSGNPSTPNPFATPTLPPASAVVPAGAGPNTPRNGTPGDLLKAIIAVPSIDNALTSLQRQVGDRIQQDWRRLSTGEQIGVVSTTVLIGAGALAGVLSDPTTRRFALDQLNGKTFPVPGLNWLRLEMNTGNNNLMLGMHVDVGRLLPPSLGFGPSSPNAMGGPPQP